MSIATPYECETTITHARNMMYIQCGRQFVMQNKFTINTKRGIFGDLLPDFSTEGFPALKYFGIGIQGIKNTTDGANASVYKTSLKDMDLYTPIPFRMVRTTEDLTADERKNYRIRTKVTVDGVEYFQYWLKLFKYNSEQVSLIETDFATGTSKEINLSDTDLNNPQPVDGSADTINTGARIYATTPITCALTGAEFTEVAAVYPAIANVLSGFPLVTELGFYTGVDRAVEHPDDGVAYTEALYTQLAGHMCMRGIDLSQPKALTEVGIMIENGSGILNSSLV